MGQEGYTGLAMLLATSLLLKKQLMKAIVMLAYSSSSRQNL